jgi:hypothetical protein
MAYPLIELVEIDNPGILGGAVKFTVIINLDTAPTSTIKIEAPDKEDIVSATNMTKDGDGVYSYVFQSSEDYDEGRWVATITIGDGTNSVIREELFDLQDPWDTSD